MTSYGRVIDQKDIGWFLSTGKAEAEAVGDDIFGSMVYKNGGALVAVLFGRGKT